MLFKNGYLFSEGLLNLRGILLYPAVQDFIERILRSVWLTIICGTCGIAYFALEVVRDAGYRGLCSLEGILKCDGRLRELHLIQQLSLSYHLVRLECFARLDQRRANEITTDCGALEWQREDAGLSRFGKRTLLTRESFTRRVQHLADRSQARARYTGLLCLRTSKDALYCLFAKHSTVSVGKKRVLKKLMLRRSQRLVLANGRENRLLHRATADCLGSTQKRDDLICCRVPVIDNSFLAIDYGTNPCFPLNSTSQVAHALNHLRRELLARDHQGRGHKNQIVGDDVFQSSLDRSGTCPNRGFPKDLGVRPNGIRSGHHATNAPQVAFGHRPAQRDVRYNVSRKCAGNIGRCSDGSPLISQHFTELVKRLVDGRTSADLRVRKVCRRQSINRFTRGLLCLVSEYRDFR